MQKYSVSPDGEKFPLPEKENYKAENEWLNKLVKKNRELGREIVIVMGVGFVGTVMAAIIADSTNKNGKPTKFVIGMQRPSVRSYWKIPIINRGDCPISSEDPEVAPMIKRCVLEKKTLVASFSYEALSHADIVVIDIQCDYTKTKLGDCRSGFVEMKALEKSFGIIGEHVNPDALILIETTVPPGTTENVANPIIKKEFKKREITSEPLLAHSYERVMPGKHYIKSIRDFWRVCSGINEKATEKVVKFLNDIINTDEYPLTVLDKPIESETAKIVENSYRATILAFMDEWSLFSEKNNVDLIKVLDAIRVRPTHDDILFPGPGIGGYCLPKDGPLGMWAYKHILGFEDNIFSITPLAVDINDTRALYAAQLVRDAMKDMNRPIAAADILILGASYREDVGDTRYSGSELIVRKLAEMGAEIRVHDPYVDHWWEFEKQETYPTTSHSRAKYFRNQEKLKNLKILKDLNKALKGAKAVVFSVRHKDYLGLDPDYVIQTIGQPAAIIDCFGILDDEKIKRYLQLGCEVKGLGRGHIQRIKDMI
ncbi:MAG: nucleotide sugar dehydrogenase [Candidatus Lokiarchaeota archaeon]|nr:nucleotide sugar dehydrogenase [Candidatus Lokiarchaeota archaeon]